MSLEEFYGSIAGDLAGVRGRLLSDERVIKFVKIFFDDPVNDQLVSALEAGDMKAAFRASHTLKGLADSMAFTDLHKAAYDLTEALRPGDTGEAASPGDVPELMARVQEEYSKAKTAYEQSF